MKINSTAAYKYIFFCYCICHLWKVFTDSNSHGHSSTASCVDKSSIYRWLITQIHPELINLLSLSDHQRWLSSTHWELMSLKERTTTTCSRQFSQNFSAFSFSTFSVALHAHSQMVISCWFHWHLDWAFLWQQWYVGTQLESLINALWIKIEKKKNWNHFYGSTMWNDKNFFYVFVTWTNRVMIVRFRVSLSLIPSVIAFSSVIFMIFFFVTGNATCMKIFSILAHFLSFSNFKSLHYWLSIFILFRIDHRPRVWMSHQSCRYLRFTCSRKNFNHSCHFLHHWSMCWKCRWNCDT